MGRIYGENAVNFTGLKQTMTKLWCVEGSLKMVELKNKMYQFVFSKKEGKRVLEKIPWHIALTSTFTPILLHPCCCASIRAHLIASKFATAGENDPSIVANQACVILLVSSIVVMPIVPILSMFST